MSKHITANQEKMAIDSLLESLRLECYDIQIDAETEELKPVFHKDRAKELIMDFIDRYNAGRP